MSFEPISDELLHDLQKDAEFLANSNVADCRYVDRSVSFKLMHAILTELQQLRALSLVDPNEEIERLDKELKEALTQKSEVDPHLVDQLNQLVNEVLHHEDNNTRNAGTDINCRGFLRDYGQKLVEALSTVLNSKPIEHSETPSHQTQQPPVYSVEIARELRNYANVLQNMGSSTPAYIARIKELGRLVEAGAIINGQFNGLTSSEHERLAILAEEAAEVIQAAMKIMRHGYDFSHPERMKIATNRHDLTREIGDFNAIVGRMIFNKDLDPASMSKAATDKDAKLDKWTRHQPKSRKDW